MRHIHEWSGRLFFLTALGMAVMVVYDFKISGQLASLLAVWWLLSGRVREHWNYIVKNPLGQAILLYCGWMIISLFWSDYPKAGFGYAKAHWQLLYILIIPLMLSKNQIRLLFRIFIYSLLPAIAIHYFVFYGIINAFWEGYPLYSFLDVTRTHFSILIGIASFGLYLISQEIESSKLSYIHIALSIILFLLLFQHGGRGGQLAIFTSLAAMTGYVLYRKKGILISLLMLMLVPIILLTVGYTFSDKFKNRIDLAKADIDKVIYQNNFGTSVGTRLGSWWIALSIIQEHPLGGVGMASHIPAFNDKLAGEYKAYKDHFPIIRKTHFHNEYIEVTTQLGVVGLTLLLYLFFQTYREGLRRNNGSSVYVLGVVVLFMTNSLTQVVLSRKIEVYPMILLLVFLYFGYRNSTPSNRV